MENIVFYAILHLFFIDFLLINCVANGYTCQMDFNFIFQHREYQCNNTYVIYFYAPASIDQEHVVFGPFICPLVCLSICLFVHMFVCLQKLLHWPYLFIGQT